VQKSQAERRRDAAPRLPNVLAGGEELLPAMFLGEEERVRTLDQVNGGNVDAGIRAAIGAQETGKGECMETFHFQEGFKQIAFLLVILPLVFVYLGYRKKKEMGAEWERARGRILFQTGFLIVIPYLLVLFWGPQRQLATIVLEKQNIIGKNWRGEPFAEIDLSSGSYRIKVTTRKDVDMEYPPAEDIIDAHEKKLLSIDGFVGKDGKKLSDVLRERWKIPVVGP